VAGAAGGSASPNHRPLLGSSSLAPVVEGTELPEFSLDGKALMPSASPSLGPMGVPKWNMPHVFRLLNAADVPQPPTRMVGIVSHDNMVKHAPFPPKRGGPPLPSPWDGERPERLAHTMEELDDSGLLALCARLEPLRATRADVLLGTMCVCVFIERT
jgi:hypothetical protein